MISPEVFEILGVVILIATCLGLFFLIMTLFCALSTKLWRKIVGYDS